MADSISERSEQVINGIPTVGGIAYGRVVLLDRSTIFRKPAEEEIGSEEEELQKFRDAVTNVENELARLSRFADRYSSDDTTGILSMQREILHDPDLHNRIAELISSGNYSADRAIYDAFEFYIGLLKSQGHSVLKTRIIDIRDIRNRLVRAVHQKGATHQFTEDSIVVTDEFSASEIIMLTRHKIRGFISDYGGLTSHASIVAGSMGLPMIIDTKKISRLARNGDPIIIDGDHGKVIVHPEEGTVAHYEQALDEQHKLQDQQQEIIEQPNETQCGHPFTLRANIEFEEEVHRLSHYKADGVGLLRTESFFLSGTDEEIDVSAQMRFYRSALEHSNGNPVTIRLLDVGGDKILEPGLKEANPFLGWRGIRVLLDRRDLLRAQLEAILRVSADYPGLVRILVPMVSSIEELEEVRSEIDRMYNVLQHRNCNVSNDVQLGVMIEVPSTAIQADLFARRCDFLSIGTNDLTQFVLAVDRGNARISNLYRQLHPAVWKMIASTVEEAHKYRTPVSVCGEMAANPLIASLFIGMGIDELSVASTNYIRVKKALRSLTHEDMKIWADRMELAETKDQVDELIRNWDKFISQNGNGGV